ncbi:hypothetical protein BDV95DRAFT_596634 [Massariosphaeria phaeospora]|uniref:Uncharacterized protein n=1 Tax=Massariosphaeria phaeospora TaxID=100035 RepID=A0A7C8I282_9PLEO|nr:hypothetical protein BDV95DRAFT_596634 [Massariosphaeria phaeospora]
MPPTQVSAHYPSPKRKRDQPPPIPLLNTALRPAAATSTPPPQGSPAPESGASSPRNAVADQLRGMTLTAPLTPTDDAVRKRPKLSDEDSGGADEQDDFTHAERRDWESGTVRDSIAVRGPDRQRARDEVPETPQSPQQPRIFADIAAFAQPTIFTAAPSAPAQQLTPTPPPALPPASTNNSCSRSAQPPRQRPKSPLPSSPPLSALTWQDSEITGHLADPSIDPEDDGTGLNGIGFKPTPAMAHARVQRRRQQLMDWRAREAREARAKRSERRRRGVRTGAASREVTVERDVAAAKEGEALDMRRTVKFAI